MSEFIPQFHYMKKAGLWSSNQADRLGKYKADLPDGSYFITIAPPKKSKRSIELNSYYWCVVVEITRKDLGYSKEEMHSVFGNEFLSHELIFAGKVVRWIKSTSKLNNKQMWEYIEQCRQVAAEHDIYIPDPEEVKIR